MATVSKQDYLSKIVTVLKTHWPDNRTVNIVCHGHSVPSGYFATPFVDTFNAYPHLLHRGLKARFPYAVINVIVTAIGGENSQSGARRFEKDVLCHRPEIVTIDYCLNDRGIGLEKAKQSWEKMITAALERNIKLILMTPTVDNSQVSGNSAENALPLIEHAEQVRALADQYGLPLVDSLEIHLDYIKNVGDISDLLSQSNHPSRLGHQLVANELLRWFPFTE